eukprot:jgi/Botrbrau1/19614/Bobra.0637s0002.1
MRVFRSWQSVLVAVTFRGAAAGTSSVRPALSLVDNWSSDSEVLLGWPWAARLGWNRTLPMCGADQMWNKSAVNTATAYDFYRGCLDTESGPSASWKGIICNEQDQVIALFLDSKELTGRLPSEWAALSQLRFLELSDNQLEGSLPSEWAVLNELRFLFLSNNQLEGSLSTQWGQLRRLEFLDMGSNLLNGTPARPVDGHGGPDIVEPV